MEREVKQQPQQWMMILPSSSSSFDRTIRPQETEEEEKKKKKKSSVTTTSPSLFSLSQQQATTNATTTTTITTTITTSTTTSTSTSNLRHPHLLPQLQALVERARNQSAAATSASSTSSSYVFRNAVAQSYVQHHRAACRGKERLVEIVFESSGLRPDKYPGTKAVVVLGTSRIRLDQPALCHALPTMEFIQNNYGTAGPIIHGLETCAAYQDLLLLSQQQKQQPQPTVEPGPRVGGLYHSGTNALSRTLENNLHLPVPKKSKWDSPFDLPWGKHIPSKYRFRNTHPSGNPDRHDLALPIIVIRNPFPWMSNMCREGYDARFIKFRIGCPKLVLSDQNHNQTNRVVVRADQTGKQYTDHYATLADMWSEWYREYLDADYPRLMIRYEDTLLYGPEIMEVIRVCSGAASRHANSDTDGGNHSNHSSPKFVYHAQEARAWGGPGSLFGALTKLGKTDHYFQTVGGADQEYLLHKGLDQRLMQLFHYPQVPTEIRPESKWTMTTGAVGLRQPPGRGPLLPPPPPPPFAAANNARMNKSWGQRSPTVPSSNLGLDRVESPRAQRQQHITVLWTDVFRRRGEHDLRSKLRRPVSLRSIGR